MASVKWSSPVRRAGSTPLIPIPNEIYVEIFDYLSPSYVFTKAEYKHTLSNLALVCRLFCAMALPRIFKSIEFSGSMCKNESTATPSYAPFCRAIIKGQELAVSLSCHVKECTFVQWRADKPKGVVWVQSGFLKMYGQAIGRMSNLQSIVLKSMTVDKRFLKVICGLRGLQSLSIKYCLFLQDITDTVLQDITPLKLKSLACEDSAWVAKVLARIVSPSNLEYLRVDAWSVARGILEQIVEENSLVRLEIADASDDPIFWKVLELSKAIKTLRIISGPSTALPSWPLSPSSLPKLGVLEAPLQLALNLVPGRPLYSVIISGNRRVDPAPHPKINFLKKSTIPIRVLQIPVHFYLHTPFDEFAQLEALHLYDEPKSHDQRLSVTLSWFEDEVQAIAQKWRSTPPIRELHLKFPTHSPEASDFALDLQLQHRLIVIHLAAAFPSVNVFSFVDMVYWRKDPHTNSWIPSVPVECYEKLFFCRSESSTDMRDFNGCLSTVFSLMGLTPHWSTVL